MRIAGRWHLNYWGFSTFRFKHSVYLPTLPVFDSWDLGPWEIRHFRKRKYRRPTAAPLVARLKKKLERKKSGPINKGSLEKEMKKIHDEARGRRSHEFR